LCAGFGVGLLFYVFVFLSDLNREFFAAFPLGIFTRYRRPLQRHCSTKRVMLSNDVAQPGGQMADRGAIIFYWAFGAVKNNPAAISCAVRRNHRVAAIRRALVRTGVRPPFRDIGFCSRCSRPCVCLTSILIE
jgi:hypothetical protein